MSEYETIKPTEFTTQPVQQHFSNMEKSQTTQQPNKKKKSSNVNKIILAVVVVCIVLLVISGIYYAFFVKSNDDEIETSEKMRVDKQHYPISQPQKPSSSIDDKILSEMTKKKPQSVMSTKSAVEKVKNVEGKLFTIVEEPTKTEMEEDFKSDEQQNILIREALSAENDIEYQLEEPEESEEPEEPEEDCVVINIEPVACDFTLSSGKRAGQPCGRRCKDGTRCTNHVSK